MNSKSLIRQRIQNITKKTTPHQKTIAADRLTKLVLACNKININTLHNFACYWPMEFEINTVGLINYLLHQNKNCYLPYMNADINKSNHKLAFIQYDLKTKLVKNQFGILEPEFDINKTIDVNNLDVIFMPVVAFDCLGHRIGSGAGLYDRTLAIKSHFKTTYPMLIGLAYAIQEIAIFTPDVWDINLDLVITEEKVFNVADCVNH